MEKPLNEKMKIARSRYKLSSYHMSGILGLGANMWHKYEKGLAPNKSNRNLILIAITPMGFKKILDLLPKQKKEPAWFANLYLKVTGMVFDIENELRLQRDEMNENYFRN